MPLTRARRSPRRARKAARRDARTRARPARRAREDDGDGARALPGAADKKSGAGARRSRRRRCRPSKQRSQQARAQVDGRVARARGAGVAGTASDAVLHGAAAVLRSAPAAEREVDHVVGRARRRAARRTRSRPPAGWRRTFSLSVDTYRAPIRVDQLAEAVVVHMMKKGLLGKAKPAPVELGKYVMVAFERTADRARRSRCKREARQGVAGPAVHGRRARRDLAVDHARPAMPRASRTRSTSRTSTASAGSAKAREQRAQGL